MSETALNSHDPLWDLVSALDIAVYNVELTTYLHETICNELPNSGDFPDEYAIEAYLKSIDIIRTFAPKVIAELRTAFNAFNQAYINGQREARKQADANKEEACL